MAANRTATSNRAMATTNLLEEMRPDGSSLVLRGGVRMPRLGFGTGILIKHGAEPLKHALQEGVRLVDTAVMYRNEKLVAEALTASGLPRSAFFVVSKAWPYTGMGKPPSAQPLPKQGLVMQHKRHVSALGCGYVDLYLLHRPTPQLVKQWQALVELKRSGLVRAIGLSNANESHVQLLSTAFPPTDWPSVVQNDFSAFGANTASAADPARLSTYLVDRSIVRMSHSPIKGYLLAKGGGPLPPERNASGQSVEDMQRARQTVLRVANTSEATPEVVLMQLALQQGVSIVFGSGSREHIRSNLHQLSSFSLREPSLKALCDATRGCLTPIPTHAAASGKLRAAANGKLTVPGMAVVGVPRRLRWLARVPISREVPMATDEDDLVTNSSHCVRVAPMATSLMRNSSAGQACDASAIAPAVHMGLSGSVVCAASASSSTSMDIGRGHARGKGDGGPHHVDAPSPPPPLLGSIEAHRRRRDSNADFECTLPPPRAAAAATSEVTSEDDRLVCSQTRVTSGSSVMHSSDPDACLPKSVHVQQQWRGPSSPRCRFGLAVLRPSGPSLLPPNASESQEPWASVLARIRSPEYQKAWRAIHAPATVAFDDPRRSSSRRSGSETSLVNDANVNASFEATPWGRSIHDAISSYVESQLLPMLRSAVYGVPRLPIATVVAGPHRKRRGTINSLAYANLWHWDMIGSGTTKALLYMTDVDQHDGCMAAMLRTEADGRSAPFEMYTSASATSETVGVLGGPPAVYKPWIAELQDLGYRMECLHGPAGTLVLFDVNIVHRGSLPSPGRHRDFMLFRFLAM